MNDALISMRADIPGLGIREYSFLMVLHGESC